MQRTLQRCLVGSTVAHVGLLVLVVVLSGWAAKKIIQPDVPVLELIPTDLRLTMGDQVGGGTSNPRPLATREGTPPPRPVPAQPPPQLAPQAQPSPRVEARPLIPDSPVKPSTPKIEVATQTKTFAKAQDVDPIKLSDKPVRTVAPVIRVSATKKKWANDDEQAEREAAEQAATAAAAREQRLAGARSLANRLSGAAAGVSRNVGGSTQIEMPGPGGAAYAPYFSWLQTFLKQQWRKPGTSSEEEAYTGVEVTIARDGTVLGVEYVRLSGVAALDASVEELFRRNRKLRPLPDEFKESRLVVPVKFVLDSKASP